MTSAAAPTGSPAAEPHLGQFEDEPATVVPFRPVQRGCLGFAVLAVGLGVFAMGGVITAGVIVVPDIPWLLLFLGVPLLLIGLWALAAGVSALRAERQPDGTIRRDITLTPTRLVTPEYTVRWEDVEDVYVWKPGPAERGATDVRIRLHPDADLRFFDTGGKVPPLRRTVSLGLTNAWVIPAEALVAMAQACVRSPAERHLMGTPVSVARLSATVRGAGDSSTWGVGDAWNAGPGSHPS